MPSGKYDKLEIDGRVFESQKQDPGFRDISDALEAHKVSGIYLVPKGTIARMEENERRIQLILKHVRNSKKPWNPLYLHEVSTLHNENREVIGLEFTPHDGEQQRVMWSDVEEQTEC